MNKYGSISNNRQLYQLSDGAKIFELLALFSKVIASLLVVQYSGRLGIFAKTRKKWQFVYNLQSLRKKGCEEVPIMKDIYVRLMLIND